MILDNVKKEISKLTNLVVTLGETPHKSAFTEKVYESFLADGVDETAIVAADIRYAVGTDILTQINSIDLDADNASEELSVMFKCWKKSILKASKRIKDNSKPRSSTANKLARTAAAYVRQLAILRWQICNTVYEHFIKAFKADEAAQSTRKRTTDIQMVQKELTTHTAKLEHEKKVFMRMIEDINAQLASVQKEAVQCAIFQTEFEPDVEPEVESVVEPLNPVDVDMDQLLDFLCYVQTHGEPSDEAVEQEEPAPVASKPCGSNPNKPCLCTH